MFLLEKWTYVDTIGNLYLAPENHTIYLHGKRYKAKGKVYDKRVRTSEIVSIVNDNLGNTLIKTFSGSTYLLGEPQDNCSLTDLQEAFDRIRTIRQAANVPLGTRPKRKN